MPFSSGISFLAHLTCSCRKNATAQSLFQPRKFLKSELTVGEFHHRDVQVSCMWRSFPDSSIAFLRFVHQKVRTSRLACKNCSYWFDVCTNNHIYRDRKLTHMILLRQTPRYTSPKRQCELNSNEFSVSSFEDKPRWFQCIGHYSTSLEDARVIHSRLMKCMSGCRISCRNPHSNTDNPQSNPCPRRTRDFAPI